MKIEYNSNDTQLTAEEYVALFRTIWPREKLNRELVSDALKQTINITARDQGVLIGCTRILTDGYLFATITELMVNSSYSRPTIGPKLIQLAGDASPTHISFGVHAVNDEMMRAMGWTPGPTTYIRRKTLPSAEKNSKGGK
jgi:hypothetical protein